MNASRSLIWLAVLSAVSIQGCGAASSDQAAADAVVAALRGDTGGGTDGADGAGDTVTIDDVEVVDGEALEQRPPIVLWCLDDKGTACMRAAEELGVRPTLSQDIPRMMITSIQDLQNDCTDPQVEALANRLTDRLALEWGRWHDHTGEDIASVELGSVFAGAGCINCCNPTLASVKIHEVEGSVESMYLVRVWEAGAN